MRDEEQPTPQFRTAASSGLDLNSNVNLTNCEQEPIRLPGSIQAHGFFLGLLPMDGGLRVAVASENAASYLHRPLDLILGQALHELLPADTLGPFAHGLPSKESGADSPRFLGTMQLPASSSETRQFQVVGYRLKDLQVLEFECVESSASTGDLNTIIANFVAALEQCSSAADLCRSVTVQIRKLTGFDRVMLYQFDEEGHGTVLAEDGNDRLPSYLGLRFPASDIPRQARELYVLNRVRIIPDVEYVPSPLVSFRNEIDVSTLDLSLSILRSVSPIHRDYMRNMRTLSSMSVSIVAQGKLWGLISAHHSEPKTVPYLVRSACDVLSRITATQLTASQQAAEMSHAIRLKSVHTQLLTHMAMADNYIEGLVRHPDELCALTGAKGAAIIVGDRCICLGESPAEDQVLTLSQWLTARLSEEEVFATDEIGSIYDNADYLRARASGVLAISLSQIHRTQLLWFRPEVVETVHWAGEPAKNQEILDGVLQIHPRNSFSSWKQIVHGKSEPWTSVELESAKDFRNAILEIVLKKAEELADMASELEVTNKELEAFSYSVSHDLRAPFRHISGFAELLLEDEADRLSERGKRYLGTIAESAQFAGLLVDSLLNFSRLSRTPLEMKPVPMRVLAEDVWKDISKQELNGRTVAFSVDDLPTVKTDVNLMRQVWRNLLSNAAKYTRQREQAVISVTSTQNEQEIIFSVTDNGVGFDNQYAHKLFGVFQRLHRVEEFEGTGIGLANVRRIITRMGGRTWAVGRRNEGASFYFSLPASALVDPASIQARS